MEQFLYMFLKFVDKHTDWKENNDTTNSQVVNEFINRNRELVNNCIIPDVSCRKADLSGLIQKCKTYYKDHTGGGNLHIILDDENIGDSSINVCRDHAIIDNDTLALDILDDLEKLTLCQRLDLVANHYELYCS
jgi:hypothetical protein